MSYHHFDAIPVSPRCHFCGAPGATQPISADGARVYICSKRQQCQERMADTVMAVLKKQGLTETIEEDDGYAD